MKIPEMCDGPPVHVPPGDVEGLADFIQANAPVLVVTGAGCSTASGIPAYRDAGGRWLQRRPIFYQAFIGCSDTRRRYWARSFHGWPVMASAAINPAHEALVRLERSGSVSAVLTQNVDGLHRRAGQRRLIELHGRLDRVRCLDCRQSGCRHRLQDRLVELNRRWSAEVRGINADGDAELDRNDWPGFKVADCEHCGGRLKPEVVFFGESVPACTRTRVDAAIDSAGAVLVVGSSLVVGSAWRVVREAVRRGLPIAAVNQGRTRADAELSFKVDADCAATLASAVSRISPPDDTACRGE